MTPPPDPQPAWPDTIENLLRIGSLSPALRNGADIAQYLANARDMLADARKPGVSVHGAFTLAYEGLHCLAMAMLNHYAVRAAEGRGHRAVAMQLLSSTLSLKTAVPGADMVIGKAHERRNNTTYNRPVPPIPAGDAKVLAVILDAALPRAAAIVDDAG